MLFFLVLLALGCFTVVAAFVTALILGKQFPAMKPVAFGTLTSICVLVEFAMVFWSIEMLYQAIGVTYGFEAPILFAVWAAAIPWFVGKAASLFRKK